MLARVRKPPIELSLQGEQVEELLDWIRKKYDVAVLADEPDGEFVPLESTEYWKEMEKNRIGNLLAGARLKAGLTQAQLAAKLGIRQNMVSDYERGRRRLSPTMARRLSDELHVAAEHLRSPVHPQRSYAELEARRLGHARPPDSQLPCLSHGPALW